MYDFKCSKCNKVFEELCELEETKKIKCQNCKSKKIIRLFSSPTVIFKEPKGTSKEDNFDYVAKWNYEKAVRESTAAKESSRVNRPYRNIDDTHGGNKMNYTI